MLVHDLVITVLVCAVLLGMQRRHGLAMQRQQVIIDRVLNDLKKRVSPLGGDIVSSKEPIQR